MPEDDSGTFFRGLKPGSQYDGRLPLRSFRRPTSISSNYERSPYDDTIRNGRYGRLELDSILPFNGTNVSKESQVILVDVSKIKNIDSWSMDDEKLIEAVRTFPCLWRVSSKAYKDIRAKENAWKETAKVSYSS